MAFHKNGFQLNSGRKVTFFCPLCHYRQGTNSIEKMTLWNHLQLGALTLTVTLLFWDIFQSKGLFLYFIFWGAFEFTYRLRKRDAVVCESCGFDPYLFVRDKKLARQALKKHWEKRIETENLFSGIKLKNYRTAASSKVAKESVPNVDAAVIQAAQGSAAEKKGGLPL